MERLANAAATDWWLSLRFTMLNDEIHDAVQPFGDWVEALAAAARADRAFPKNGDPEAVHAYLRPQQADDAFQAIEDAQNDRQSGR